MMSLRFPLRVAPPPPHRPSPRVHATHTRTRMRHPLLRLHRHQCRRRLNHLRPLTRALRHSHLARVAAAAPHPSMRLRRAHRHALMRRSRHRVPLSRVHSRNPHQQSQPQPHIRALHHNPSHRSAHRRPVSPTLTRARHQPISRHRVRRHDRPMQPSGRNRHQHRHSAAHHTRAIHRARRPIPAPGMANHPTLQSACLQSWRAASARTSHSDERITTSMRCIESTSTTRERNYKINTPSHTKDFKLFAPSCNFCCQFQIQTNLELMISPCSLACMRNARGLLAIAPAASV